MMRLFGFEITRSKQYGDLLSPVWGARGGGGWFPIINEPFAGAWQRNLPLVGESLLAYHAIYACIDRIASDIAKCRIRLVEQDANMIWSEVFSAAFSPVLRKPNSYQTRIQFFESWICSKLIQGNTYVLKNRDNRNIVTELYVLEPRSVWPYVAPNGDIYYKLGADNLTDVTEETTVPATEIIHDVSTIRHHPLCGLPPLMAATLPATQGLRIQTNSTAYFQNRAQPGGVLTAPGEIKETTAKRIKEYWTTEFAGERQGKVAVLGDGLKFEPLAFTAVDSQLIEQLGLSAKMVCSAFGVPAHMVGAADPPSFNNIEALNQQYYSQTLQKYFESVELLLDEGLGLTEVPEKTYGTEFDLDDLLRMDTATMMDAMSKGVGAGVLKPNEGRKKLNYAPVQGGDTPYLQQQNYSLSALNKRDTQVDPFAPKTAPAATPPAPATTPDEEDEAATAQLAAWELRQELDRLRGLNEPSEHRSSL
jgi:HK97 family phage portal protein